MKLLIDKRLISGLIHSGLVILFMACGSANNRGTVNNFEDLKTLVDSREFEIESNWANPLGGSRIYLNPGSNFVRFEDDKVQVFLPYFGVRHTGGYGSDGGINYEGPPRELRIEEERGKKRIDLHFRGKHDGEDLQFYITLFQNGSSTVSVNSSQRSSISYQGDITRLPEGE